MTRIDQKFRRSLADAIAWANATGWPTKSQDMAITIAVVQKFAGKDVNLALEIAKALPCGNDDEGLRHRAVLCRVAARLTGILGPAANES